MAKLVSSQITITLFDATNLPTEVGDEASVTCVVNKFMEISNSIAIKLLNAIILPTEVIE
ncbi:hypothetical protein [Streptococcus saliviloxodontae]|uniref:Uncharacterized protein n=1 Tax=Streptococcus saliviloxodontae TaxID=1349416 RepID=A0ABS2PNN5_9STRE|nr:hypothetical protein [Streptococcus saliviloxodontae]MBM7636902.1 hypothetical protein [Streptococcus saliviloxodontae]